MYKRFRCKIPMNLQTFAEGGEGGMEMPVPADQASLVREMDRRGSSRSSLIMTDWQTL